MIYFLLLLSLINFSGLAYLTFLYYRKIVAKSKPDVLSQPKNIKLKLTRFNPFDNVGSDQSFVFCLLDNTNSGVIITSLHNRESTRVYAKTIKNGQGENDSLSKEETQTLIKTINS
ncbi:MAG TPA: DUF4446 family protein [Candidatus Woesebacteria bacterium]|nr:DUF4446 family protein [Candidatus Woesebacteria bacterium]HPJ16868.1 DUF4446 family protein [Candidatus Woesebacteria bacterium]